MCKFSETNSREQLRLDEQVWRLDAMLHECLGGKNVMYHFEIDRGPKVEPGFDSVGFTVHCWFESEARDYIEELRSIMERVVQNFLASKWNNAGPRPGRPTGSGS